MTARRAATAAVNAVLVLVIVGTILATWWPAVYVSDWFQHNRWVRAHVLGTTQATPPAAPPPANRTDRSAVVRSATMPDRSPFPGMDPWLEVHWEPIHQRFITDAVDQLSGQVARRPVR